jgi:hypothetical protein
MNFVPLNKEDAKRPIFLTIFANSYTHIALIIG